MYCSIASTTSFGVLCYPGYTCKARASKVQKQLALLASAGLAGE